MCNNTKQKIAATLRQMMTKRSFDKITVTNLMDATNMQRQSFYYHFQDTRDVLMWICRDELFRPLAESQLEFSEWLLQALSLLESDRAFFRRVVTATYDDFSRELSRQAVFGRVADMIYGQNSVQNLSENQRFVVQVVTTTIVDNFLHFAMDHQPLDIADTRQKINFLLKELTNGRPKEG